MGTPVHHTHSFSSPYHSIGASIQVFSSILVSSLHHHSTSMYYTACTLISYGIILSHCLPDVSAVQPVNRYFSAESPNLQPDLECLVGMDSADVSELYKVKCTEAWNISIKYERSTANTFAGSNYISEHDRRLRTLKFGIQGSGLKYNAHALWKNWTNVNNWVCSYTPVNSVLIYDCIPENQAPPWWKEPLMGPAFPTGHKPAPKEMRHPGCNGGVCYCNKENYCNDRHKVVLSDDCPFDQPHHKWDKRCKHLKNFSPEKIFGE